MSSVVEPVAKVLGPVASVAGPVGQIASVVGAVQGIRKPKAPASAVVSPAQETPFVPTKPSAMSRPGSLQGFAGFDPQQERSALATRGLNTGLGGEESAYYKNLVSRSLIGDDNQVTGDANSLLPVESQYFSRQGVNTSNINELLRAIMGG